MQILDRTVGSQLGLQHAHLPTHSGLRSLPCGQKSDLVHAQLGHQPFSPPERTNVAVLVDHKQFLQRLLTHQRAHQIASRPLGPGGRIGRVAVVQGVLALEPLVNRRRM